VFLQPKDPSVVGANALKHSVAVQQSVVEDRDFCLVFIVVFSVYKYLHPSKSRQTLGERVKDSNQGIDA